MWGSLKRTLKRIIFGLPEIQPDVERAQLSARAYFLWEQAGRPLDRDQEFWSDAVREFYQKSGKIYRRDGSRNIKEALEFTKDWVTSLIQLDSAAIAAIGAFISLKNFPDLSLSRFQWLPLVIAVLSFMISIIAGTGILNALPGAIQRVPVNPEALRSDVFSIANEQRHWKLNTYSNLVRWFFVAGVIFFVIFIGARVFLRVSAPQDRAANAHERAQEKLPFGERRNLVNPAQSQAIYSDDRQDCVTRNIIDNPQ